MNSADSNPIIMEIPMKIREYGPYGSKDQEEEKWSVEIGSYDKIVEVYIAHTNLGIEGISFGIIDAIGRKINTNVGATLYNYGLKMKSHEFITQISGRIATGPHKTIKLLKIHTNLFPGGYFWSEVTTQSTDEIFSIQLQSTDVIFNIYGTTYLGKKKGVKFLGYDEGLLSSFGIRVKEVRLSTMKHGPYGFPESGGNWSIELDRFNYIKEIIISHDDIIHGIGFVKVDAFGKLSTNHFFGSNHGETYRVVLKHSEFIQKISGKKGFYHSKRESVIVSLRIHTNIWRSGYKSCGSGCNCEDLQPFSTPLQTSDDSIISIFGTHNNMHVTSIGFSAKEVDLLEILHENKEENKTIQDHHASNNQQNHATTANEGVED